jgi:hypothetical protein
MSKQPHFSWLFIDKSGRCSLCDAAGNSFLLSSPGTTNNASHLKTRHQVDENHELVKERREANDKGQPKIDLKVKKMEAEGVQLDAMLLYATPLQRCEDKCFQAANPLLPHSAKTLRTRIIEHADKCQVEQLKLRSGKTCTIAIDGGTIWNKYLAVVCLVHGLSPLVVACVPCETMTAEWTIAQLKTIMAKLKEKHIIPIALVADNASNMQATLAGFPLLKQRCLAHSIQLCVNDTFGAHEPLKAVWETVRTILRANNISEPPITRWSGKYLALQTIFKKKLDISSLDVTMTGKLQQAGTALERFYIATNLAQSNKATMITHCAVLEMLFQSKRDDSFSRALSAAVSKRHAFLLTDAVLVAAYFHPGLKRANLPHRAKDAVFAIVRTIMKDIAGVEVLNEWSEFKVTMLAGVPPDRKLNTEQYVQFWSNQEVAYPSLAPAIIKIVTTNPTEAECERAFSTCKFAFPRLRKQAGGDLVEATVLGGSAVACKYRHRYRDEDKDEPPANANEEDAPEVPVTAESVGFNAVFASDIIKAYAEAFDYDQAANATGTRRRQPIASELCGVCKTDHADAELPEGQDLENWVKCGVCQAWFAYSCVDIDPADMPLIQRMDRWTCPDCRTYHSVE